jgi:hypothetical protein
MLRNYRVLIASAVVLVLVVVVVVVRHGLAGPHGEQVTPPLNVATAPSGQATAPTAASASDQVASTTPPPPPPPPPSGEAPAGAAPAAESGLPTEIGACVTAHVKEVSTRLVDLPGSGSEITFDNGGRQVAYDQVPAVDAAQPGDVVRMCLVSVPEGCPPGDDRGKQYITTDLRSHGTWSLPDSEHSCGGA